MRHPNLVLFLGACLVGEPRMIVSEYLQGGSLEDVFEQRAGKDNGKPNPKPSTIKPSTLDPKLSKP